MWSEKLPSGKVRFAERYIDEMGQTRRVSVTMEKDTAQTRKLAAEILRQKMAAAPVTTITLANLCSLYLDAQRPVLKASTWERNKYALATVRSILGDSARCERLSAGWVRQKFLASGKSPGTLNELLVRFKAAIRWAYKNDVLDDIRFLDKLDNFKDTSRAAKVQDKYLEADELAALLDAMDHPIWHDLTLFLALSGLRIGEAMALKRSDLDLEKRAISVTKTYDTVHDITTTPKTYASEREVYMQDELLDLCRRLSSEKVLSFSDLLFNNFGERISYNAYRTYLRKYSQRAIGRPVTPHVLRHTHASLLMEQGMEMDAIAARLGHDDSNITRQIYAHVTKKLESKWNEQVKEIRILAP